MNNCELCNLNQDIVLSNQLCYFLQQPQDVLIGSGIIIPKRHCQTVFDLTLEEWNSTYELLQQVKNLLDNKFKPDGYNIGWNVGEIGG